MQLPLQFDACSAVCSIGPVINDIPLWKTQGSPRDAASRRTCKVLSRIHLPTFAALLATLAFERLYL